MNRAGPSKFMPSASSQKSDLDLQKMRSEDDLAVRREYDNWLSDQREAYEDSVEYQKNQVEEGGGQMIFGQNIKGHHGLTLGYVTKDACPGKGDDIEHIPCEFFQPPRSQDQSIGR